MIPYFPKTNLETPSERTVEHYGTFSTVAVSTVPSGRVEGGTLYPAHRAGLMSKVASRLRQFEPRYYGGGTCQIHSNANTNENCHLYCFRASREHRQDSRPHARHRQRVRAGLRHALRQPAKRPIRQPRGRRRTGPGRRALEWLPRLVGRSRALEIVLSGDDFDADIAERYGWVNRTLDDGDLDTFVDALVRRVASFDRETLAAAKAQINRFGTPTATELQSSIDCSSHC